MNVVYASLVAVALTAVLASGAPHWQPAAAVAEYDAQHGDTSVTTAGKRIAGLMTSSPRPA
jgi:hypothetical protein